MMTPQKEQYLNLAEQYTEAELAEKIGVGRRTIRRYATEFGIKPKPTKFTNKSLDDWKQTFDTKYRGQMHIVGELRRTKTGHISGKCQCEKCGAIWTISVTAKLNQDTGCIRCDKGHHGNKYSEQEVTEMLNSSYAGQWKLIKYGHYSQKDSIIQCQLCKNEQLVKLSDFAISTHRCAHCQTGSFGEYVIANVLAYNNIEYQKEFPVKIQGHNYRIDFLINRAIAIEYSGKQHFQENCIYFKQSIIDGINAKQIWCNDHSIQFVEIKEPSLRNTHRIRTIIDALENALGCKLETPPSEFFKENSPEMTQVLNYMLTHSARQTAKDLNVPTSKIKRFVQLDGFDSISQWQNAHHN